MKSLVEHCQKLNINDLVRDIKSEFVRTKLKSKIDALEQNINITSTKCHFGNERLWFICPSCSKRVGILYKPMEEDLLLCRKCHNLQYSKSRFNKMKGYS